MRLSSGVAGARTLVGVAMLARPRLAEATEQPQRLLVQTIGIRDVVVGASCFALARGGAANRVLGVRAGLASDLADTVLAAFSFRSLGRRAGAIALLAPVPFVAAGVVALKRERTAFVA